MNQEKQFLCNRCWELKPLSEFELLTGSYKVCNLCAEEAGPGSRGLYAKPNPVFAQERDRGRKWWQGTKRHYTLFVDETPADDLGSEEKGGVYLLRAVGTGLFKIGKTANVERRVRTLQLQCPVELELICFIESSNTSKLETELHRSYCQQRAWGEWFRLERRDVEEIKLRQVGT